LASEADDAQLIQAVHEYVSAKEAGQTPGRDEFLSRYPSIAGPLAECLEAFEFVQTVGPRLEEPLAPGVAPSEWATPLGDFRLLREIGRGGMGVVYEAEQLSLGRRIALKVLPFALTLDPRQLQRFKNEARAAAHLHHSNIVPIYSVGCERGVHFYAMQYIEGQTLAAVLRELQRGGTEDRGSRTEDR
jgi:serine/threonine protein kinase